MDVIREQHPFFDGGAFGVDRLNQFHKGQVEAEDAVFGVIDDPGYLIPMQPRVDGMQDSA